MRKVTQSIAFCFILLGWFGIQLSAQPTIFTGAVPAENPAPWKVVSFLEDAGLVRRYVFDISFESNGTVWVAASDGAYRYDGYQWRRYTIADGLPSDFARSVQVLRDGSVWVGTAKGAARLENERFIVRAPESVLAGPSVRRIKEDPDGTLWFCSDRWPNPAMSGGLTSFQNGKWTKFSTADGLPSDHILEYFRTSTGRQLAFSKQGTAEKVGVRWRAFEPAGLTPQADCWDMVESEKFGLFAESSSGVFYSKDGLKWEHINDGMLSPLCATRAGEILRVTLDGQKASLASWNGSSFDSFQSSPTTLGFADALREAPDGSIWMLGKNHLSRWQRSSGEWLSFAKFNPADDTLGTVWFQTPGGAGSLKGSEFVVNDKVRGHLLGDGEGAVWSWAEDGKINKHLGNKDFAFGPADTGIRALQRALEGGGGNLWLIGRGSREDRPVAVFDGTLWQRFALGEVGSRPLLSSAADPQAGIRLCFAGAKGNELVVFHLQRDTPVKREVLDCGAQDLPSGTLVTGLEGMWLISNLNLFHFKQEDKRWLRVTPPGGMSVFGAVRGRNRMWFLCDGSTGGGGFASYANGSWKFYPADVGDFIGRCHDGTVVISAQDSIYLIEDDEPHRVSLPLETKIEHIAKDDQSRLWLGTDDGTLCYRADHAAPRTVLTSFSKEERFEGSFHFAALVRERGVPQNRGNFHYSWRFDRGPWSGFSEIPPQGVSLEEIPSGIHTFEVRARNERGDVDPVGAKARFTVLPAPLQKRAVFRLGLAVAGLIMIGLVSQTIRRAWQISKANEALRVQIAERELVQEALLRERALLNSLMDNIPDRIYFKDMEGRFTRVNRAKALVSGRTHPDELVGRSDRDFFSESDARRSAADEQMVMSSGQPLIGKEEEFVWGDGRRTWVSATKMPLRDKEGRIVGTFGISRNITDMKRAQRDLESQRLEYQTIFDTVPAFVVYKDGYNRHVRVNKYAAELLGRPVEELAGSSVYDLDPQNAQQYHRDDLEVIETGKPKRGIVEQLVTKSGAVRWLLADKIPYRDLKDQVIGVIIFAIDITEKKIAQEELERAKNDLELRVEARTREISDANATMQKEIRERRRAEDDLSRAQTFLDSVVENLPIPVFIKEARELRFVRWNRAGVELTGYSNAEMLGKNDFDIFPREEAAFFAARDREAIARGELVDTPEEMLQTRHNGARIMHTRKIPILDEQGRPLYLLGICEDITGRKQAEVELKTAKEAAEAANKAKSEFLANMSHEIRTPMNGVIGMTNLLLETGLDEEQRDYAQTVRASAESLLTVINDILDFSKIESGKLSFACVDLNLRDVVESTLELLAERARAKGIEIGCLIDNDVVVHLKGDADRLRQVLMNLIGNALKFTAQGEVFVQISQTANRDEDATLHFEVRDTGIGIDEAAQARLFKAFSQADTSTTRKYGGTGLGLVISQKLIEMMQGKIGVRSAPQQGSTFWFDITLPKQAAGNSKVSALEDTRLTGLRVLVVDDNATNRRILRHQIGAFGMYHEGVESGEEALARLREAAQHRHPFQLAILDMQMPGMDGFSLAIAIKQETQLSRLRLIMLTSMGMRLDEDMMRQAGLEACLIKPVRQSELINAVRSALSAPAPENTDNAVAGALMPPQSALPVRDIRVLLAEDNLVNQKVALRQLQKLGYQVDVVSNGREAVEAIRRTAYEIILMDCQMPELDGYEASRRIRADESVAARSGESSLPIPRIIAMTANAMQGDREKCLAAGMDDYISKPVQIDALKAVLDRNDPKLRVKSPGSVVHLNPETIASLRDLSGPDEQSALNEIIELFEQDAPGCLDSLRKSCAEKDALALKRVAHAFKGSCGNMGADHLAAMCASVEHCLQKSAWAEAEGFITRIEAEYVHVSRELSALRDLTSVS